MRALIEIAGDEAIVAYDLETEMLAWWVYRAEWWHWFYANSVLQLIDEGRKSW